MEGGVTHGQVQIDAIPRPRIGAATWTLLAADGAARALDAYSTHRMLRNQCGSRQNAPADPTCNVEDYLPHVISAHESALYAFEGTAWLTEYLSVRFLVNKHHPRLARLIPLIDVCVTAPFAVNNLTLPIYGDGELAAGNDTSSRATRSEYRARNRRGVIQVPAR